MPWDMNDFPSSLKNLDKSTRKKALDIANALIDEGYDESRAIPIATTKAKEWANHASATEKQDFMKNADPTIRKSGEHSRPELLNKPEMVIPHPKGWAVQSESAKKATKVFEYKKDAVDFAKGIAKNKQSVLIIQRQDGETQDKIDYS